MFLKGRLESLGIVLFKMKIKSSLEKGTYGKSGSETGGGGVLSLCSWKVQKRRFTAYIYHFAHENQTISVVTGCKCPWLGSC
jgi:hypothetical protein